MIQMIECAKIWPHRDNPRKDLGDLTELAESIKSNGVMQNLTIVKRIGNITGTWIEGTYTVVIGHRRLAAAELAGLEKVPCVIAKMTEQEQIATMLLENMQRSDLTVYEQAQGFQMMLDLGESVADIAEKTGFSDTTVRRRVKLLELDQDKFKESAERGATLMDYAELEKIQDIGLRNEVLEKIGTHNFEWALRNAVEKEKSIAAMKKVIEQLQSFATEVDTDDGLTFVRAYHDTVTNESVEIPEDKDVVSYYYRVYHFGSIYLYREKTDDEIREMNEQEEKSQKERARYKALEEIAQRAYFLRSNFIKTISNKKAKGKIDEIVGAAIHLMSGYRSLDIEELATLLGITLSEDDDEAMDELFEDLPFQPYRYLLLATYCQLDSNSEKYHRWDSTHCENDNLDNVYTFLEAVGYEMSDEEKQLQDGTHELFTREIEK